MKILIPLFSSPTGTWGGLTRVTAIARAAEAAGHEIAFCASGSLADDLRAYHYPIYPVPQTTMLGLPPDASRWLEQRAQRISLPVRPGRSVGNIWFLLVGVGLARTGYLRRLVAAEIRAVQDFGADALFTDYDLGAFVTAQVTGLPLAFTYASILRLGIGSLPWRLLNRALQPVLAEYNLPPCTPDGLSLLPSVLKIIPSIPELDGTDPTAPNVCYVGQLTGALRPPDPAEFQPEPGKRYVFTYVGSGSISLDWLETVLPQVFPAGGDTICLVGAQTISEPYRLGAVEFRRCVPAHAVLPYCDWTICHGGLNTIMQSLQNNVPLIIFPGPIFERRYNAERVTAYGGGIMGELDMFTPEWFAAALQQRAACAAGTAQLGERIRSYGGAAGAIAALEAHASGR